jgi:D-3-phosphoglycerate dehydrogenase / 2-oxoglutarate reductase
MVEKFRILTLNNISALGLQRLPTERYEISTHSDTPDAILLRSQDMHGMTIPASVKALGRAGAGTNNIPVSAMAKRGIPVFNTPGANANAVKELVLTGMLVAARNLIPASRFVDGLRGSDEEMHKAVEEGKKRFAGIELPGHMLGIIGLGKIGSLVADAAIKLGMDVLGYDPDITVDAAWSLPAQVKRAHSIEEVMRAADFVTVHVPLLPATRGLISAQRLALLKSDAILLNFARDGIVDDEAIVQALAAKQLRSYVCDFPSAKLAGQPAVVAFPHLGASTREAEDNCAVMVAEQVRAFLEHGNIRNAVNFPDVAMPRESPYRLCVANANVPNMLGQISTTLADAGLNIHNMLNKSKGEMAYTMVDVDSPASQAVIARLAAIAGVLGVRYLPQHE